MPAISLRHLGNREFAASTVLQHDTGLDMNYALGKKYDMY